MTTTVYTAALNGLTIGTRTSVNGKFAYSYAVACIREDGHEVASWHTTLELAQKAAMAARTYAARYYRNKNVAYTIAMVTAEVKIPTRKADPAAVKRGVLTRSINKRAEWLAAAEQRYAGMLAAGPAAWAVARYGAEEAAARHPAEVSHYEAQLVRERVTIAKMEAERAALAA
jgi:hypothetical protein